MPETLLPQLRQQAGEIFHWWLEGIRLALPLRLQEKLLPQEDRFVIRVRDGKFSLRPPSSHEPISGPLSELRVALLSLNPAPKHVFILLDEPFILYKTLDLPANVDKDLVSVIRFEIERLTPFQLDDILFDYAVSTETGKAKAQALTVQLCLAPKAAMEDLLEQLQDTPGFTVLSTTDETGDILPINLLHPPARKGQGLPQTRYRLPFRPRYFVGAIAAMLLLAHLPPWSYMRTLDALENELSVNREEALRLRTAVTEHIASSNRGQFIKSVESRYIPPINLLRNLTDTLPEDTWLGTFALSDTTVQLSGNSRSAAEALEAVESSPFLSQAEFSAPVSSSPEPGKEEFQILASSGFEHD